MIKKKENKDERSFVQLNMKEMNFLRKLVGVKGNKYFYCKEKINFKKDKYSIFNKPYRLICGSVLCLSEAIGDDE
jgi:hypothetical protein